MWLQPSFFLILSLHKGQNEMRVFWFWGPSFLINAISHDSPACHSSLHEKQTTVAHSGQTSLSALMFFAKIFVLQLLFGQYLSNGSCNSSFTTLNRDNFSIKALSSAKISLIWAWLAGLPQPLDKQISLSTLPDSIICLKCSLTSVMQNRWSQTKIKVPLRSPLITSLRFPAFKIIFV